MDGFKVLSDSALTTNKQTNNLRIRYDISGAELATGLNIWLGQAKDGSFQKPLGHFGMESKIDASVSCLQ